MKPPKLSRLGGRSWRLAPSAEWLQPLLLLLAILPGCLWAAGTFTIGTEAALRAALAGGGTVTLACDGVITLGNPLVIATDTKLDGSGHQITLSGGNAVRVFSVNTNVTLTLLNLTVAAGKSTNGAGIFNAGGTIILSGSVFQTNAAWWSGPADGSGPVAGGAIFNQSGAVFATNCLFLANQAAAELNQANPPVSSGGAIHNEGGNLVLENCAFVDNQAAGDNEYGSIYTAGDALGGAIYNHGTNRIDLCVFQGNSAAGGHGGETVVGYSMTYGGVAAGGAVCSYGNLIVGRSSFTNNSALGGNGNEIFPCGMGGDANGGAVCNYGMLQLQCCTLACNRAVGGNGGLGLPGSSSYLLMYGGYMGSQGGQGGGGGAAAGGLFNAGTANLTNTTVALNFASGGNGGAGGTGGDSTIKTAMGGPGGNGGAGGSAFGGIRDVSGLLVMACCTVASNTASAGSGGSGGMPGSGPAGGQSGSAGSNGIPAGGVASVSCAFVNSLLAGNTPLNFLGTNTNSRNNLSSDASCAFSGAQGVNLANPLLGPLANYGGPTLTLALLPGSPALDAGYPIHAPATDQRGVARPQGVSLDIGAFEFQYLPVFTALTISNAALCQLQMAGLPPNVNLALQTSSNLINWATVTNFMATNQVYQLADPLPGQCRARFYRLTSAN
jgi:hypothetical protein